MLNDDVDALWTDDDDCQSRASDYAAILSPGNAGKIRRHEGDTPLFDLYRVDSQADKALEKLVWLKSGGSLVIEETEALTVIDVNTGKNVGGRVPDDTIFQNNCEAAREIAIQLRLRDIGGIVIIDFIDMDKEADRQKVLQTLKDAMRDDHTRSHVFGFTHLGLVELTRKKTGRSIGDTLKVTCPYCQGEAKVLSPYTVFNRLRKQTLQVLKGCKLKRIYMEVSPDVAAAMEELMKKDGELFPEARDADFYVKANPALHAEKFTVKPLPDKRVAEAKKNCRIMH
jgi:ribonuclease G